MQWNRYLSRISALVNISSNGDGECLSFRGLLTATQIKLLLNIALLNNMLFILPQGDYNESKTTLSELNHFPVNLDCCLFSFTLKWFPKSELRF